MNFGADQGPAPKKIPVTNAAGYSARFGRLTLTNGVRSADFPAGFPEEKSAVEMRGELMGKEGGFGGCPFEAQNIW